jgi:hypothetical protein
MHYLKVKMGIPEDGFDESRNASEYKLNSVTWCMKSAVLNTGLMKTEYYIHNTRYIKVKAIPLQVWTGPKLSRSLGLPDFKTIGT